MYSLFLAVSQPLFSELRHFITTLSHFAHPSAGSACSQLSRQGVHPCLRNDVGAINTDCLFCLG